MMMRVWIQIKIKALSRATPIVGMAEVDDDSTPPRSSNAQDSLPLELKGVDFTKRVSWGKYAPYNNDRRLPITTDDAAAVPKSFTRASPALTFTVRGICGRARAATLHLKAQPGQAASPQPVLTPMFMPVGTKGCLKAVSFPELADEVHCPIILANTYHLAIQPGTELIQQEPFCGLHGFQQSSRTVRKATFNLLTDSGGFQMVSLAKLSVVTEDGVSFENPYRAGETLLLRPEDSMGHQMNISANIIMALDDVISTVATDRDRFITATHRTLRWYDRCYAAVDHEKQNLFPIVQGGLDTELGGLREISLAGFRHRQEEAKYVIPGYAIGGLSGGEEKDKFWRVVDQCCKALPDDKPRYLMGVGYPLDLVVCTALGIDMFDCVYPTRTARFGVALVPTGILKLKSCMQDASVIDDTCTCQACRYHVSRDRLRQLCKTNNPVGIQLVTQHNITYMMRLVGDMRRAVLEDRFPEFCRSFVHNHFPDHEAVPTWVVDALNEAGITLSPSN
jgi:queuine tRNA-ribosyltransferase catalytic subunit